MVLARPQSEESKSVTLISWFELTTCTYFCKTIVAQARPDWYSLQNTNSNIQITHKANLVSPFRKLKASDWPWRIHTHTVTLTVRDKPSITLVGAHHHENVSIESSAWAIKCWLFIRWHHIQYFKPMYLNWASCSCSLHVPVETKLCLLRLSI